MRARAHDGMTNTREIIRVDCCSRHYVPVSIIAPSSRLHHHQEGKKIKRFISFLLGKSSRAFRDLQSIYFEKMQSLSSTALDDLSITTDMHEFSESSDNSDLHEFTEDKNTTGDPYNGGSCSICKAEDRALIIVCGGGNNYAKGCGNAFHPACVNKDPVLPEENWICPTCADCSNSGSIQDAKASTFSKSNTKKKPNVARGRKREASKFTTITNNPKRSCTGTDFRGEGVMDRYFDTVCTEGPSDEISEANAGPDAGSEIEPNDQVSGWEEISNMDSYEEDGWIIKEDKDDSTIASDCLRDSLPGDSSEDEYYYGSHHHGINDMLCQRPLSMEKLNYQESSSSDDEDYCCICGRDGFVMVCDGGSNTKGCGKCFHIACVKRGKVPVGDWICGSCSIHMGLNAGLRGYTFPIKHATIQSVGEDHDKGTERPLPRFVQKKKHNSMELVDTDSSFSMEESYTGQEGTSHMLHDILYSDNREGDLGYTGNTGIGDNETEKIDIGSDQEEMVTCRKSGKMMYAILDDDESDISEKKEAI